MAEIFAGLVEFVLNLLFDRKNSKRRREKRRERRQNRSRRP